MTCPTCKNEGVLNTANNQEFWYCRTCKTEIVRLDTPADSNNDWDLFYPVQDDFVDMIFDYWTDSPLRDKDKK